LHHILRFFGNASEIPRFNAQRENCSHAIFVLAVTHEEANVFVHE